MVSRLLGDAVGEFSKLLVGKQDVPPGWGSVWEGSNGRAV
jgi:hypothetical protein